MKPSAKKKSSVASVARVAATRKKIVADKISDDEKAELLRSFLQKTNGATIAEIIRELPLLKKNLSATLNALIAEQKITVEFSAKQKIKILPLPHLPPLPITRNADEKSADEIVPEIAFKRAYDELERGKTFVRICDLRRRLAWEKEFFEATLVNLRNAEKVQLQTGDLDFFTADDVRDSFNDENGFQMLNVMWRY